MQIFARARWARLAAALLFALLAEGCGGAGGSSSDWYYHWNCNGDSDCLATNPEGTPSGTVGPISGGQVGCNELMTFGNHFWGPVATQSCDQSSTQPPARLVSITVTPANLTLPIGLTQQYKATATYSDGTSKDMTTLAAWSAGNGTTPIIATISSSGLATAAATGSIQIKATLESISGSTSLHVTAATLQSMTVTPADPTINQYLTQQFTSTGHYSDGSSRVVSSAGWSSGTLATATISATGLATALTPGTSIITASVGSISGNTLLTVSAAVLQSIAVTPTNPSLAKGGSLQLTAMGTYSNGAVRDITAQVTWASADSGVAPISSSGLVTASTPGSSLMSATLAGVTGSTTVMVTPAVLQSIAVTPASPSVETGLTRQLTATGTYSDGSTLDMTSGVAWTSGTPTNATVDGSGLVRGVTAGTSLIEASFNGISGSTTLTVVTLGSSWAPVTSGAGGGSGTTNALMGITWTGTQFVTAGVSGTIMTSPDGIIWTVRNSGTTADLNAVAWTGAQLLAFGASGTILTSSDGVTWTLRTSGVAFALNAATWTGTQIVVVGNSASTLTSPDGITWTTVTPAFASYDSGLSVAWDGTYFIVGTNYISNYVNYPEVYASTDLLHWTYISALSGPYSYGLLWTGTQFVAVQSGGNIRTSPDGFTWAGRTSGTTAALRAVAWSSSLSLSIIVGDAGTVLTSPDSVGWTSRTSGTSNPLRGVAFSAAHIVAVGDAGTILFTSP